MSATEIVLIVIGAAIFLLGYLMPARKKDIDEEVQLISEDEVRKMVSSEVEHVKDRIEDIIEETVNYSIERTERAMERVTNEKIMAINEYSDTVLEEINKNHKEVVFLYDMLNDKHDNLLSSINEATVLADDIKQTVKDAELTAAEAADKIDAVLQAADDASDIIRDAEDAAMQAQNAMRSVIKTVENKKSDLISIHNTKPYQEDVVEEVREIMRGDAQPAVLVREEEPLLADITSIIGENRIYIDEAEKSGDLRKTDDELPDGMSDVQSEGVAGEEFAPITPRRVEIVHRPDNDYVTPEPDDMSTSEAFASMGLFAPRTETFDGSGRRTRTRRSSRRERMQESVSSVDIQFVQEDTNGRNSNERILELHKAGKSNMAIAKELGLGLGEVKLVIDLFEGM